MLSARWRSVAKAARMGLEVIATAEGLPVFALKSPALSASNGVYFSAGIHGDEPGGCAGLLAWAEAHVGELRGLPVLIFPCLNPWGLGSNRRSDSRGNDLNRMFHKKRNPVIAGVQRAAAGHEFRAALMLHEDYDGEGVYLDEHATGGAFSEAILDAASPAIPRDPRTRIDGWRARGGVLRPRIVGDVLQAIGYPEAVWLFQRGCHNSITFETPSEFALERRVAAQVAAIEALVSLVA